MQRLTALDGTRGLAALAVVLYHFSGEARPSHGYLAVDLFFLLSGFVLASVYEDRLRAGLTVRALLGQRLARLWPLYLVGITGGLLITVSTGAAPVSDAVSAWALNLVFLSGPHPVGAAFWLDPSVWSLSLEVGVNLLFALGLWRARTWVLFAISGVAALVLVFQVTAAGAASHGWEHDALGFGMGQARVMFSFPLGWALWRVRARLQALCTRRASVLALVGILACMALPGGAVGDLVAILVVLPLALVALALGPQPQAGLAKASSLAGALSYPVYVIYPIVASLAATAHASSILLPLGILVALAWIAQRTVEPVGRQLIQRLVVA
jgi:peptidoglycan/LPS O-acetylase OafA/YrhL